MGRKPRHTQAADKNQQVKFLKHKTAVLKKAQQLSKMCDYEVAVIFVSKKTNQISPYANVNLEKLLSDILEQKIPTEAVSNQGLVKLKTMKKGRKLGEFDKDNSSSNGDSDNDSAVSINPLINTSVTKHENPKDPKYAANVIGVADSFNDIKSILMQKQHCDSVMEINSDVKSNQWCGLASAHFSPKNDGLAIPKDCPLSLFCQSLSSGSDVSDTCSFQGGGYKVEQLPMPAFSGGVTDSNIFWKSGWNEPPFFNSTPNCSPINARNLDYQFSNASSGATYTTMQGSSNIDMNNYNFLPYPYPIYIPPNPSASNPLSNPIFMPGPW